MKKRFLPFSLLLVIMILGQSVMADPVGHYVPRVKENSSADAYLHSLRANQQTGLIDPAWLVAASKQVERSAKDGAEIYWKSMGPDNMGGRTTAVLYNNQNTNEAYIGSMGGGVFYTWNKGISWHQVGENLMVSCMAQKEDGTIYVGTGDCGIAQSYNGLDDYTYENSFLGTGLYKIQNKVMTLVEGTSPVDNTDPNGEWSYINDVAIDGETVIVATSDGLRYLDNNEWKYAKVGGKDLTGMAHEVKVGANHLIIASVDGKFYVGSLNDLKCKSSENGDVMDTVTNMIDSIAVAEALLDIAINDTSNVIFAAAINSEGNHSQIYISEDQGDNWSVILPTVGDGYGHQVYAGRGRYNHALVIDPKIPGRLYVLGQEMWILDKSEQGYYVALQISSAALIHNGLNAMTFSPKDKDEAYVATDGGIFKASRVDATYLTFTNCNRGYTATRCLGVAPTNSLTRVVAGVLDQGPILIDGIEGTNNMETGDLLMPELTGAHFGVFDDTYNSANCVVSTIQPNAFVVTSLSEGRIQRTKTAGVDYDFSNFTASARWHSANTDSTHHIVSQTLAFDNYRYPFAYWETYDDEYSTAEVLFKCKQDYKAGDVVTCFSNTGDYSTSDGYPESGYPFFYTLPHDMHYNAEDPELSDSIYVHDPISTKMIVPHKKTDKKYELYYTVDGIRFSKAADWYLIYTIETSANKTGCPTCMTMTPDGDHAFIGTYADGIYRISNLRQAVDDATCDLVSEETWSENPNFAPVITKIELPTTDQCVTSISVFTDDPNKIVVTLGNYGNTNYVLYSTNALSSTPTFTEKQGNMPAMPVYTSVFTSTYDGSSNGDVLVGTDHGVWRTTNISSSSPVWTLENANMGDVPVMDLKQQVLSKDELTLVTVVDSVPVKSVYQGINNQGVIYAATYGRGLFRCDAYRQNSGYSVHETPAVAKNDINIYPNPVRDAAKVSFELNNSSNVSYQVYDMSGRMVKAESLGNYGEGKHEVNVTMDGLAKGAYVLRLNAGSRTSSVKFMVF